MTALPRRTVPLLVAFATVLAACGGSKTGSKAPSRVASVPVDISGASVQSGGANVQLTSAQKDAVSVALSRYITSATTMPLQTGSVGTDLADVFDAGALADVNGTNRDVMLDAGFPTGTVTVAPVTATLDAVTDASGNVAIIDATMKVDVRTSTGKGPIHVVRSGTYVFTPEGNRWRIRAYDVTVTRETPDGLSTTTSTRR